jgi:hypothetical protein
MNPVVPLGAQAAAEPRSVFVEDWAATYGSPDLVQADEPPTADVELVEDGERLIVAEALAADAYHVVASLQLKLGNEGPAWMAADASMRAAQRSGDPITMASSARIVTHVLDACWPRSRRRDACPAHGREAGDGVVEAR